MNTRIIRAGVVGGVVGGLVMAGFAMTTMWLVGSGFWTPVNLIANTFWRGAPLDGTFSVAGLVIGVAVHMVMALLFATLIAIGASRLPANRSLVVAGGLVFAPILWVVMQYGIWHEVDGQAAEAFTPWVMAIAHLLFGMLAALFAAIVIPDRDSAYEPVHARPGTRAWGRPAAY